MFKMDPPNLTVEALKEVLFYDERTGHFTWLKSPRSGWVGKRAGWLLNSGYRVIEVFGHTVLAHRLAWFYSKGTWPVGEIDHRDRERDHNQLRNLRDVPKSTNQANVPVRSDNTSGFAGISWHEGKQAWVARIQREGRRYWLGAFSTVELAVAARSAADIMHRKLERTH